MHHVSLSADGTPSSGNTYATLVDPPAGAAPRLTICDRSIIVVNFYIYPAVKDILLQIRSIHNYLDFYFYFFLFILFFIFPIERRSPISRYLETRL